MRDGEREGASGETQVMHGSHARYLCVSRAMFDDLVRCRFEIDANGNHILWEATTLRSFPL